MLVRLDEVVARVPGAGVDTWYGADAFTAHFRGVTDDINERYRDLAAASSARAHRFSTIGSGGGEFLELLRDLQVDAFGIEVDETLVETSALTAGLRAEIGAPRRIPDEPRRREPRRPRHDPGRSSTCRPQHVIDVVRLAAEKVPPGRARRGGDGESHPRSTRSRMRSGSTPITFVRSPPRSSVHVQRGRVPVRRARRPLARATDESLELVPGDDELSKRLTPTSSASTRCCSARRNYAIVATR